MRPRLRAYADLLRLQFSFAWPILFVSGYLLATSVYGGFSWTGIGRVALIGFFGFEAGFILNDYVDRDLDRRDVEKGKLTGYWRPFGSRPIAEGLIPASHARGLFILFTLIAAGLILTFPQPHSVYVLLIMLYSFTIEVFYQEEKRNQKFPFAQLIGRTDFALFPVAGYLVAGKPDLPAVLWFVFFYPFALAHLGANDLIDVKNDEARGMKTIPVLFGRKKNAYWIAGFSLIHGLAAILFMTRLGFIAQVGILAGLLLILYANSAILREKTPDATLRVLPCFHVAMILYAVCIGISAFG
ncbi:MAG TPA: UbiA family prenyltransferase [Methanoregula sp.]|nr:UbiA family prenyltransferase [Methanoregula sp.]